MKKVNLQLLKKQELNSVNGGIISKCMCIDPLSLLGAVVSPGACYDKCCAKRKAMYALFRSAVLNMR